MNDCTLYTEQEVLCNVWVRMSECEEGELEDFPRRMREWLFNVMEELAGRGKLSPYFSKMHQEEVQRDFFFLSNIIELEDG